MSESQTVEHVPAKWDEYEGKNYKWDNLVMQEVVYSDLPSGAAEAIAEFVRVDECNGSNIERVERLNPQTLEIIWYDDEGEANYSKDWYRQQNGYTLEDWRNDKAPTKVNNYYIEAVRQVIQSMFGDHWRVRRKSDGRQWDGESPQRAIVQRADHQRFRYIDESHAEYRLMLHGRPENVPETVRRFGELDNYPEPPESVQKTSADVYVYESDTGTKHLIPRIRGRLVALDGECECGLKVQREDVADADGIKHYGEYLQREGVGDGDLGPHAMFGDDLCTRCWKSYSKARKDHTGKIMEYTQPVTNSCYEPLLDWEADHNE